MLRKVKRGVKRLAARTRLTTDARKDQLLALGLEMFGHVAYDEISIDDIAARAKISKGLLYHYFPSKRRFYVAVVEAAGASLERAIETDPALPGEERARRGLDAYLGFVEEKRVAYLALMKSGIGMDPEVAAIAEGVRRRIGAKILEGIGVDEARPAFRVAARSFVGAVEAASLDFIERRDLTRAELVALLLPALATVLTEAARLDPEAGASLPQSTSSEKPWSSG